MPGNKPTRVVMNRLRRASTFLVALILCGCAAAPSSTAPTQNLGLSGLRIEPQFVGADGTPVGSEALPHQPLFAFRLKPGSLFGVSVFSTVELERLDKDRQLAIDLNAWLEVAARRSLPASDSRVSGGVRISPAETRFAQVSPLVYAQDAGQHDEQLGLRSYFVDAGGQAANLIYFDRACKLEGTFHPNSGRRTVTVDIKIAGRGFYLLSYVAGLGQEKYWLVLNPHAEMIQLVTTL